MTSSAIVLLAALQRRQASRRKQSLRSRLSRRQRRLRDRRVVRAALQQPSMSGFAMLFGSGDDPSLITLTALDHKAFRYVLGLFEETYTAYTPYGPSGALIRRVRDSTRGRPRLLDATKCLALALAWTRTRGAGFTLCIMFGITASVCSLFVRFGRRIIVRALAKNPLGAVRMPSAKEIQAYQRAIHRRHSRLSDVFAVADGLKLYLQQSGNCVIQNIFFNGWKHDHYVGNVLVFVPDGTIAACALNAPGSVHDSQISEWGGIYQKLQAVYELYGARCVVDSAFAAGDYKFLIKSSQDYLGAASSTSDVKVLRQATSARQAAEWGMRAFQSSFPRLKDRLDYEERGERRLILDTCVLLYNFRARVVGINQLRSVYMPSLERHAVTVMQDS